MDHKASLNKGLAMARSEALDFHLPRTSATLARRLKSFC